MTAIAMVSACERITRYGCRYCTARKSCDVYHVHTAHESRQKLLAVLENGSISVELDGYYVMHGYEGSDASVYVHMCSEHVADAINRRLMQCSTARFTYADGERTSAYNRVEYFFDGVHVHVLYFDNGTHGVVLC